MLESLPALRFEGHALVSVDGMIADAGNRMPPALRNEVDWDRVQAALETAAIVVSGRVGHETHPNPERRRLVLTRSVARLAPGTGNATMWNPAGIGLGEALTELGIATGTVVVAGVFDVFVANYDSFVLSEMSRYSLPGGTPCFSRGHPRVVLAEAGLHPMAFGILDPEADVTTTIWERV
jgi:hypothetical protein